MGMRVKQQEDGHFRTTGLAAYRPRSSVSGE
jgi:hypothetical protein